MAAAAGVGFQAFDNLGDLVDALTALVRSVLTIMEGRPIDPLLAIDRTEIAPLHGEGDILDDALRKLRTRNLVARRLAVAVERPVGPDFHALSAKRPDVGLAGQEPQELARRGLPKDPLGGDQRHLVVGKVEPHRRPEQRAGAYAGPVRAFVSLLPDAAHQLEVLPFVVLG